jgi:hypothetical protein
LEVIRKNSTFAEILKTNYLINEDEAIFTQLPIHDNDAVQCYDNGTAGIACLPWC